MDEFDAARAEAIREQLIAHIAERPRRRRAMMAITLVLAGALGGAGVSVGAFAATGSLVVLQPAGQPQPDLPDAVPAPPGVIPGAPVVSLLGDPLTVLVGEHTEIDLTARSRAATHARVTVTPESAGTVGFGTAADGNNPSASWGPGDTLGSAAATWDDLPLDDTVTTLYVTPSDWTGIVTVQFVTHIPTELGVNARGETYGVSGATQGAPDLVAVSGFAPDGTLIDGYVRATDLDAFSPDHPGQPSNPDEALEWQTERDQAYPGGWDVPVYEADGVTRIGAFHVGN